MLLPAKSNLTFAAGTGTVVHHCQKRIGCLELGTHYSDDAKTIHKALENCPLAHYKNSSVSIAGIYIVRWKQGKHKNLNIQVV